MMRYMSLVFLVPVFWLSVFGLTGMAAAEESGRLLTATETDQVRTLQERMLNDKEIMALIQDLQSDPEMQELLTDQSVMNAVATGDITTLTGNARFMRLLENARVKDIQRRLKP